MLQASAIKEFASELGLDVVRITSAEPVFEAEYRIKEQVGSKLIPMDSNWQIRDLHSFCSPKNILPTAKSIIVVAECYLTSEPEDLTTPGNPHGRIARYTWSNYYHDIRTKLKQIAKFLKKEERNHQFKCLSNGPLAEKPLAQRAGLGWYGKHGIILTKNYGSWVVLGELITDIEIEPDEELELDCRNCRLCISACPTKAIIKPYIIDRAKCLQHIMSEYGTIPLTYREKMNNFLYGCTICQEICPQNKNVLPKDRKPDYGYVGSSVPLIPILKMSEEKYRAYFKHNQIGAWWVRRECIQRNAAVALGNIGNPIAIPILIETLNSHPDAIVREHTAWALGKIGGAKSRIALEKCLMRESNNKVKEEIKNSLTFK
ncbi:tRNA epoxyqueuosine(34) reductase QueG [candidate division WOR-3 bacterium]|nr:tRNA epoxyqueuosine(34) reductase QueG [candidate division WOR-3 bacterium]